MTKAVRLGRGWRKEKTTRWAELWGKTQSTTSDVDPSFIALVCKMDERTTGCRRWPTKTIADWRTPWLHPWNNIHISETVSNYHKVQPTGHAVFITARTFRKVFGTDLCVAGDSQVRRNGWHINPLCNAFFHIAMICKSGQNQMPFAKSVWKCKNVTYSWPSSTFPYISLLMGMGKVRILPKLSFH